jgi:hypothetical protein
VDEGEEVGSSTKDKLRLLVGSERVWVWVDAISAAAVIQPISVESAG